VPHFCAPIMMKSKLRQASEVSKRPPMAGFNTSDPACSTAAIMTLVEGWLGA
jgi:hypothetical protein